MNKFILFALVILAVFYATTGHPGGPKNGTRGNEERRRSKFNPCTLEKCEAEVKALKSLRQAPKEQDECHKKCNPEGKKFHRLSEAEVKKIKDCLAENKCIKDPNQRFNYRNSTEFQAFMKCKNEKCPDDSPNFSTFRPTELPLNSTAAGLNSTTH